MKPLRDKTIQELWEHLVQAEPGAPAVLGTGCHGHPASRLRLDQGARAWLARLPEAGLFRGRRVALAQPNGLAWLEAFLGLQLTGAVPVLLDAGEPLEQLRAHALRLHASWLWNGETLETLGPLRPRSRTKACLVKVTSGSTALPKGLAFTHAQMIADGRQVCSAMGIGPGDLNLAVIPLGHSYGLGNLVIPLLIQGTPVLCVDAPLPSLLGEACQRWRPTVFPAVPTLLRALVRSGLERADLDSLRLVISAGSPLGAEEAREFANRFGLRVHNFYGSTETGGICFDTDGGATLEGRSVGAVMDGVRLEFRTGDRFVVRSAAVQRPSGHSPADLGRLNERGELVLLGRVGKQVKLAGRRLDLAGLETELCRTPGVRGAVAGLYSGRRDVLTALVATDLGEAELRALLTARMAAWRVPGRLRVLRELPLTPRGKVDRACCLTLLNATAH